jgi:hypothetical protein
VQAGRECWIDHDRHTAGADIRNVRQSRQGVSEARHPGSSTAGWNDKGLTSLLCAPMVSGPRVIPRPSCLAPVFLLLAAASTFQNTVQCASLYQHPCFTLTLSVCGQSKGHTRAYAHTHCNVQVGVRVPPGPYGGLPHAGGRRLRAHLGVEPEDERVDRMRGEGEKRSDLSVGTEG